MLSLLMALAFPTCTAPMYLGPYSSVLVCMSDKPALIMGLIETESSFRPKVVSSAGAVGLMQVLPATAGLKSELLKVPVVNVAVGMAYLEYLIGRFDGDIHMALNAYNKGPTRAIKERGIRTRYAKKVIKSAKKYKRSK